MKNIKIIKSASLFQNVEMFGSKKICAMVKSNAYGHGLKEIVTLLDPLIQSFGVVCVEEGAVVRKYTQKPIVVVGKVFDFKTCKKHNLQVMVDDYFSLNNCIKYNLKQSCHLNLNSGMNRFGIKTVFGAKFINEILQKNDIKLQSIYTHFPNLRNKTQSYDNYQNFLSLRKQITQDAPISFGGSDIIKYPFDFDIIRVGIGLYGYQNKNLFPVMEIHSYVCNVVYAKKGEYIGYGKMFKVQMSGFYAVVPVGYGDGLRRGLSGNFQVEINGKKFDSVGAICMDAFFVSVDGNIKIGDEVCVMSNASVLAKKLKTIPYEILTGFSNFRGETKID